VAYLASWIEVFWLTWLTPEDINWIQFDGLMAQPNFSENSLTPAAIRMAIFVLNIPISLRGFFGRSRSAFWRIRSDAAAAFSDRPQRAAHRLTIKMAYSSVTQILAGKPFFSWRFIARTPSARMVELPEDILGGDVYRCSNALKDISKE